MSLSSLKKSTQSDRPKLVTVDQFIDDAVAYAHGTKGKYSQRQQLHIVANRGTKSAKMRRATYTLTNDTVDALSLLAERTGISKSRLIRILVANHMRKDGDNDVLDSSVR